MGTLRIFGRAFVRGAIQDDMLVTIDGTRIADVAQTAGPPPDCVRAPGFIVPGFIDVHVHGGDGSDFMDAGASACRRIALHHARHGTTALAATTLSASRDDLHRAVEAIAHAAGGQTPGRAEIVAIHLEGPFISAERAGAQDRASIRPPDAGEVESLLALAPHFRWIMTVAPEVEGAGLLIERFRDRVLFSIGHTAGSYDAAVAALESGAAHFTHLFNAMTGFGHRAPGVAGAALSSSGATAELIADGIHVHPAALRVAALAMPGRIALVTDAMRACGLGEGTYELYGHDVTVSGGAARLTDGTLAGSVLTMHEAVRNMVELAGLPLELVLPLASEVPARITRTASRKGAIAVGHDADLVVLDARFRIERVFARGSEVE